MMLPRIFPRLAGLAGAAVGRRAPVRVISASAFRPQESDGGRASHDEFTDAADQERRRRDERRRRADEDLATRNRVLDAGLARVAELGWTAAAVRAGAADAGVDHGGGVAGGALAPGGGADLVRRHMEVSDARLEALMAERAEEIKSRGERLRVRLFLREMTEARLRMSAELAGTRRWAEAVALMYTPENLPGYLDSELRLMDSMWAAAGCSSTDVNWYTKRLSLAAIYKSTELALVADRSEGQADTWAFLDRRFEDELKLAEAVAGSEDAVAVLRGLSATVKNLAGYPGR